MSKLRIFISHSSGDDATLVSAVADALRDEGYDVLLDRSNIDTGDLWREKVHAFLADCHAAVILFSERAITSTWVLKEATVLSWRLTQEDEFKLAPILLSKVNAATLKKGAYAPLDLGEIQHAKSTDAAEIARIVRRVVGNPDPFLTPLDRVRIAVTDLLANVGVGTLEVACADHFGAVSWKPGEDRRRTFADLLSRKILRAAREIPRAAMEVLGSLGLGPEEAVRILEILAPLWVEPDAACVISEVANRRGDARDLVLNGNYLPDFTALMYVGRAYPHATWWVLVAVDDGDAGDFTAHVVSRVRAGVRAQVPEAAHLADPTLDRWLKRFSAPCSSCFPAFPRTPPPWTRYGRITLAPHTSSRRRSAFPIPGRFIPGCAPVEPELAPEREEDEYFAYLEAVAVARNPRGPRPRSPS